MPYREGDTIVAAATPPGVGALAVVRVSGPEAIPIADRVFRGRVRPSDAPPRTILRGEAAEENGEAIDEVLLVVFRAPHSYTGEDSVEMSCHGSPYLVRRLVRRLAEAGARLAEPGEFTRRAFRNGRIDLAEAEAVADLVRARTEGAARSALAQLRGGLSARIAALRSALLDLLAEVEADLDFAAEEDVPRYDTARAAAVVARALAETEALARSGEKGRLVREGIRAVLAGRPNSGKSTLFNALLAEERAIVAPEPGTTRDLLEGEMEIGGLLFRLFDTAGLREGARGVEEEGVRRARKRLEEADLILLVIDRSEALSDEDRALLDATSERKRIVVLAKSDLQDRSGKLPAGEEQEASDVSALRGDGVAALRERMARVMGGLEAEAPGDAVLASARHAEALRGAAAALARARGVAAEGELLAEDLREAIARLGAITGEEANEELLDRIFSRFCVGK
ncbi:MAG: tRNA uridine-5-carboxymethylaminomethyl(34) synthesis GTPase MnmE [Candidatus Eisenbacteria bacterium]|nr:tRNA uridine-5-carboxymethylaminomethyl(34) synthesis GTPase MnmE [Candidatus Eisenbacteria bacterium]